MPEHSHINEQVANVERGSLLFHVGGEDQVVGAGESLRDSSQCAARRGRTGRYGGDRRFTPRREDWIAGDDAYLRR